MHFPADFKYANTLPGAPPKTRPPAYQRPTTLVRRYTYTTPCSSGTVAPFLLCFLVWVSLCSRLHWNTAEPGSVLSPALEYGGSLVPLDRTARCTPARRLGPNRPETQGTTGSMPSPMQLIQSTPSSPNLHKTGHGTLPGFFRYYRLPFHGSGVASAHLRGPSRGDQGGAALGQCPDGVWQFTPCF